MPNQVRKHIAIWSKKSCKVFNLLKNMHALLEEGNSSEQQQKFCEQLNKRAAPLLKNARFKGLPEFKGLLVGIPDNSETLPTSLSNNNHNDTNDKLNVSR